MYVLIYSIISLLFYFILISVQMSENIVVVVSIGNHTKKVILKAEDGEYSFTSFMRNIQQNSSISSLVNFDCALFKVQFSRKSAHSGTSVIRTIFGHMSVRVTELRSIRIT